MFAGLAKDGRSFRMIRVVSAAAAMLAVAGAALADGDRGDRTRRDINRSAGWADTRGSDRGADRGRDNDRNDGTRNGLSNGGGRGHDSRGNSGGWGGGKGGDRHDRHDHDSKFRFGLNINLGPSYPPPVVVRPRPVIVAPCPPPVVVVPCPAPVVVTRPVVVAPCPAPVVVAPAPVVVERRVVVERPVIIERPVVIEKTVYVSNTQDRDLGEAYLRMGDFDNAARVLNRHVSNAGGDAAGNRALGLAMIGRGEAQDGFRFLLRAYSLDASLFGRGLTIADLGGQTAHRQALDAATRGATTANSAEAWFAVALLQHAGGNRGAATLALQKSRDAGLSTATLDQLTLMVSRA